MPIHPLSISITCKTCGTKYRAELPHVAAAGETCKAEDLEKLVEVLLQHKHDPA